MKCGSKVLVPGLAFALIGLGPGPAWGGVGSRAAREVIEQASRWLGREAGEEGLTALTRRGEHPAARAVLERTMPTRPGPARAVGSVGAGKGVAARRMARPADDAAGTLVKSLGEAGARAARSLDARNARRLAMLAGDGTLGRLGRTDELLAVIEKHGDRAMAFVWEHRTSLAVGAALAAFLVDPGPFLAGTRDLGGRAVGLVTTPIGLVAGGIAQGLTRSALRLGIGLGALLTFWLAWRLGRAWGRRTR